MCRGLAVCFNWDTGFYSKGISSHSDTCKGVDDFKLEILINDSVEAGYVVEVDEQYRHDNKFDKHVYDLHADKITKSGKLKTDFQFLLDEWVRENETQILRWLLKNTTYMQAGEDQYMSYCEAGGTKDMSYCKAGGTQDMSYCECGGERYISFMVGKNKENNEFIKKLSEELGGNYNSLTWDYLVKLAIKGHKTP